MAIQVYIDDIRCLKVNNGIHHGQGHHNGRCGCHTPMIIFRKHDKNEIAWESHKQAFDVEFSESRGGRGSGVGC